MSRRSSLCWVLHPALVSTPRARANETAAREAGNMDTPGRHTRSTGECMHTPREGDGVVEMRCMCAWRWGRCCCCCAGPQMASLPCSSSSAAAPLERVPQAVLHTLITPYLDDTAHVYACRSSRTLHSALRAFPVHSAVLVEAARRMSEAMGDDEADQGAHSNQSRRAAQTPGRWVVGVPRRVLLDAASFGLPTDDHGRGESTVPRLQADIMLPRSATAVTLGAGSFSARDLRLSAWVSSIGMLDRAGIGCGARWWCGAVRTSGDCRPTSPTSPFRASVR